VTSGIGQARTHLGIDLVMQTGKSQNQSAMGVMPTISNAAADM
jgi:hypothetical protein